MKKEQQRLIDTIMGFPFLLKRLAAVLPRYHIVALQCI